MDRITESDLYAELVARYRRPLPAQPGDILLEDFAADINSTIDVARASLDREVAAGRLVKVRRSSANNKPMNAYRLPEDGST